MTAEKRDTTPDDASFEKLIAEARLRAPVADAALLARVLRDAEAVQAGFAAAAARRERRRLGAWLSDLVGSGPWPRPGVLVAGAAAASLVLGLSLGLAQPDRVVGYLPAPLGETLIADVAEGFLDEIPLDDDGTAEG